MTGKRFHLATRMPLLDQSGTGPFLNRNSAHLLLSILALIAELYPPLSELFLHYRSDEVKPEAFKLCSAKAAILLQGNHSLRL